MVSEEERCAEARKISRIHNAFQRGDLEGLRAAVDDPALVPNGRVAETIGLCLVYAIYHSPFAFIRQLLELGANPNAPVDDGFPPLIAALSSGRDVPGATRRTDVAEIIRVLLTFGADPNQRGISDYTALHMAVAARNLPAVYVLLHGGADPESRTRIDDYETPLEMAQRAGMADVVAMLVGKGRPLRERLRKGLTMLADLPGEGERLLRQHKYRIRLRLWLKNGRPVRWQEASGPVGVGRLEDDGETLITEVRVDRSSLVNGLFYGVEGMRVGGIRLLEIAPHLAYAERGVPDVIPAGAVLTAEITILEPGRSLS
jgi:uncharacterized protein